MVHTNNFPSSCAKRAGVISSLTDLAFLYGLISVDCQILQDRLCDMDALIWRDPRRTVRKLKVHSAELICILRSSPNIANPQQAEEDMSLLNQACRPYLSATAAATNFLRPALPC
jgi:hypothetical protein